ncbi:MAG: hypothetical protein P8X93_10500, partial [Gammaproteobacteria bacterium]
MLALEFGVHGYNGLLNQRIKVEFPEPGHKLVRCGTVEREYLVDQISHAVYSRLQLHKVMITRRQPLRDIVQMDLQ